MPRTISNAVRYTAEQPPSRPPRPERIGVYLKLDTTVVDLFRQASPGHQARINEVRRQFVLRVTDPNHSRSTVEQAQLLFEQHYAQCFWHMRRDLVVIKRDVSAIVHGLRTHGGRAGFLAPEARYRRRSISARCWACWPRTAAPTAMWPVTRL